MEENIDAADLCTDDMCCICFDSIGLTPSKLACNHMFHEVCLMNWTRLHKSCPICREPTSLEAEKTMSALEMDTIEVADTVAIDRCVITRTIILKWVLLSVAIFVLNMFLMKTIILPHNYIAPMVVGADMLVVGAVYQLWRKFYNQ